MEKSEPKIAEEIRAQSEFQRHIAKVMGSYKVEPAHEELRAVIAYPNYDGKGKVLLYGEVANEELRRRLIRQMGGDFGSSVQVFSNVVVKPSQ